MQGEQYKIYRQPKLTFIIYKDKILVIGGMDQKFYLIPSRHYWNRRLKLIMRLIEVGEIRDYNELASWTNPGINWVATFQKINLDPEPALA